jgi:hypothetical protein
MWNTICLEGFCMGEEVDKKYPCGMKYPTSFCLSNHICPHFAYAKTTEREVAEFVKTRHFLRDRLIRTLQNAWDWVVIKTWDKLWFNRRKTQAFFDSIEVVEDPEILLHGMEEEEEANEFKEWIIKARKEQEDDTTSSVQS